MRLTLCVLILTLLVALPAAADLSGTWIGTYTATSVLCQPAVPHGGSGSLNLNQNGTTVSGTVAMVLHLVDCRATAGLPFTFSFTGTASGDSFSATFPLGPGGISGTVNGALVGSELTFTVTAGDTTAVARAAREGTPPANVAGVWQGLYNAVATSCDPSQATGGLLKLNLSQNASSFSGTATIEYSIVGCQPVSKTIDAPLSGSVDGITFSTSFSAGPDLPPIDVAGELQGQSLVVSFIAGDTTGTAMLSHPPGPRHRAVRH